MMPFVCIALISYEPHQTSLGDQFIQGSLSAFLVPNRDQMAAFTLIRMNRTNKTTVQGYVLIQPNLPTVNTPLTSE